MSDPIIIELLDDSDGRRRYFGNFDALVQFLNPKGRCIIECDIPLDKRSLGTGISHRLVVRTADSSLCLDLFSTLTAEYHITGQKYVFYN